MMMQGTLALTSFLLILCAWAFEPRVTVLSLPDQHQGAVKLVDIAEFHYLPETWKQEAEDQVVAQSIEELKKMSPLQLRLHLKKTLSQLEDECHCQLQLSFSRDLLQATSKKVFSLEHLQKELESSIPNRCESCLVKVSQLKVIQGEIPAAPKTWAVERLSNKWRGPVRMSLKFDNKTVVVFGATVQHYIEGLKTKRNVLRGQGITSNSMEPGLKEITYDYQSWATSSDLKGDLTFRRGLKKGDWLRPQDLKKRPLVKVGESVRLEVRRGPIEMVLTATVRKNGGLGDQVPVLIRKTRKKVMAQVIGPQQVRWVQ